jgi:enoyl-CoA hydratase/carnithine racemase
MVATCDLAISATTAQFGTPGVNIGLFCSTPMVALSRAVSRKHAMEMLLTGEMIDSQTAQSRGLINRNVPDADLDQETMVLARRIASKSHRVLKTGKEAFHRQIEMPLTEAYAYTSDIMTENLTYDDAEEGIAAFIEKRPPVWHHK